MMSNFEEACEDLVRWAQRMYGGLSPLEMKSVERVRRATKIADAVEKDIAEGCVMVPREATEDMAEKACDAFCNESLRNDPHGVKDDTHIYSYKAAIAAAPVSHLAKELNDE